MPEPTGAESPYVQAAPTVVVEHRQRRSTYYAVTEDEIELYAALGHLVQFLIAAVSLSLGFVLGCLVAFFDDTLTQVTRARLMMSILIGVIASLILTIAALLQYRIQRRQKRAWSTRAETEKVSAGEADAVTS